jgi:hypothetical protein
MAFTKITASGIDTAGTVTTESISVSGVSTIGSLSIGSTQVISSAFQLQNIASLDATTTATIETAIQQAPNNFTSLNISGISTLQSTTLIGGGTSTGTANQTLQVTGSAYIAGDANSVGLGIGVTNATTYPLDIRLTSGATVSLINLQPSTATRSSTIRYTNSGSSNMITGLLNNAGAGQGLSGFPAYAGVVGLTSLNPLLLVTNALERVRVFDSGEVGIGTTVLTGTASQSLQVTGGAYIGGNLGVGATNPIGFGTAKAVIQRSILKGSGVGLWVEATDNSGTIKDNVALILNDGSSGGAGGNSLIFRQTNSSSPRRYAGIWGNTQATGTGGDLVFGTINSDNDTTGPTEKARIDSSGNLLIGAATSTGTASQRLQVTGGAYVSGSVGIGTTNPIVKLQVRSAILVDGNANPYLSLNDGTNTGYLQIASGVLDLYHNSSITFSPGGSFKALFNSSGNLGIGTASPAENLHIHNPNTGLAVIRLSGSAASQTPFNIRQGIVGANNGGFSIYDVNNSATRFAINPSGNIGINDSSPLGKLSIYTTSINTSTGYNGQNFGLIIGTDNGDNLYDEGNGIAFTQQYASDGVDGSQVRVGAIVGYKGQATGNFGGGLKFKVQPTGATPMVDAMVLTKDGNLGIGATIPGSKLQIVGDIRFGKQDYSYQAIQKVATLNADGVSGVYPPASFRFYTYPGAINTTTLKLGIRGQDDTNGETSDIITIVSTSSSSGNIGIGTTIPTAKLVVDAGSVNNIALRDDSIENHKNPSDVAGIAINYTGYNSGTSYFRNFSVYNGKQGYLGGFIGTTGNFSIGSGNLVIGTSGKGIDFSATANGNATMTSELLADYEEGTWTPVFASETGTTVITYTTQTGRYTKIGNTLFITFEIGWSARSGTGNILYITGAPYAAIGNYYQGGLTRAYGLTFQTWGGTTEVQAAVGSYNANSLNFQYFSSATTNTDQRSRLTNLIAGSGSVTGYAMAFI